MINNDGVQNGNIHTGSNDATADEETMPRETFVTANDLEMEIIEQDGPPSQAIPNRLREWEEACTSPIASQSDPNGSQKKIHGTNLKKAVHHVEYHENDDESTGEEHMNLSPRALAIRNQLALEDKEKKIPDVEKKIKSMTVVTVEEDGCLICMDAFTTLRPAFDIPCQGSCVGALVHYRCIMAWLSQSGSCPLCRGPCEPLILKLEDTLDFSNLRALVLAPIPVDAGILRCYVKQLQKGLFSQYSYELYLQSSFGPAASLEALSSDRFLLSAKKHIRQNMTSNYVFSLSKDSSSTSGRRQHRRQHRDPHETLESDIVGRMGANFLGTVFTMYDMGKDPQKLARIQHANNNTDTRMSRTQEDDGSDPPNNNLNVLQLREERGCITFEPNRTSVGPRKMCVCIPQVDEVTGAQSNVFRPTNKHDRIVNRLHAGKMGDLRQFTNREPTFREDLGAYCLDFGGRVSMASVKNFQLVATEDLGMGNILQFGRIQSDMFTLDVQWPLSIFQAFAIALSSCDTKLACV